MRRAIAAVFVAVQLVAMTASEDAALAQVAKAECVKANADAQKDRLAGHFGTARDKLTVCADASCPPMVRDDCTRRIDELERAQPTFVFEVKDPGGSDVSAVRVTVDGQLLTDKLIGRPLAVDPGEHVFTFAVEGHATLTRTFVVNEGEKSRRELLQLGPHVGAPTPAQGPGLAAEAGDRAGLRAPRVAGIALGAAGVVGIGLGTVFGLLSISAAHQQGVDCMSSTSCRSYTAALSDHATATTDGAISTIALISGGALLATGAVLWFTVGRPRERNGAPAVAVVPLLGPASAGVLLHGRL